jgi:hypothetical protein
VLENVSPVIWKQGRAQVLQTQSKVPHAWLRGVVKEVLELDDYQRHNDLLEEFSTGYQIAYNPYIDGSFRSIKGQTYITHSEQGARFIRANRAYLYESGIRGL